MYALSESRAVLDHWLGSCHCSKSCLLLAASGFYIVSILVELTGIFFRSLGRQGPGEGVRLSRLMQKPENLVTPRSEDQFGSHMDVIHILRSRVCVPWAA